jgi:hypothetical protein
MHRVISSTNKTPPTRISRIGNRRRLGMFLSGRAAIRSTFIDFERFGIRQIIGIISTAATAITAYAKY